MQIRFRCVLGVLISLLIGCSQVPRSLVEVDRSLRELPSRTVFRTPEVTLFSPYGSGVSETRLKQIQAELAVVSQAVGLTRDEPVIVVLQPVEVEASDEALTQPANKGGVCGTARNDGIVTIYVPEESDDLRAVTISSALHFRSIVRHELAHILGYELSTEWPPWLSEGLAINVQIMESGDDGRLHEQPVPSRLLRAVVLHDQANLADVLDWQGFRSSTQDPDLMYTLSLSLVRFLAAEQGTSGYVETARRLAALDRDRILALEPQWHRWLDELDVVALADDMSRNSQPMLRRAAAGALATGAELGLDRVLSPRADALARRLLGDPVTARSADAFFFYRGRQLEVGLLDELCASSVPHEVLVGQMMRSQRGLAVDWVAARQAVQSLPDGTPSWALMSSHVLKLDDD